MVPECNCLILVHLLQNGVGVGWRAGVWGDQMSQPTSIFFMHSDQVIWGPANMLTLHRILMPVDILFDIYNCFDKLTTALGFVRGLLLFNLQYTGFHLVSFLAL